MQQQNAGSARAMWLAIGFVCFIVQPIHDIHKSCCYMHCACVEVVVSGGSDSMYCLVWCVYIHISVCVSVCTCTFCVVLVVVVVVL